MISTISETFMDKFKDKNKYRTLIFTICINSLRMDCLQLCCFDSGSGPKNSPSRLRAHLHKT